MMKRSLLVLLCICNFCASTLAATDELSAGFARPPDPYKPWCYWWWLDSNASKEGITRDLEEMKKQGISGALVFDAGEGKGSPVGPVFMSDAWRELFRHALHEADRLGIELTVNICSGWNDGGTWVTADYAAKTLVWSSTQIRGPGSVQQLLPRPKVWEKNYYRDIAVFAFPGAGRPLSSPPLKHLAMKAARTWLSVTPETLDEEELSKSEDRDCALKDLLDVTTYVNEAGELHWKAPEGKWTILRIGYTLLGSKTKCVSPGSIGYEIDFFSPDATRRHWARTGEKLIDDAGALAGKTLTHVHDDSYEIIGPENCLQQNWTPEFLSAFKSRRGYDARLYLPVLTGAIVESREISDRFLRDYRRTVADLFASGHYQPLRDLAHQRKLGTHPESGGPFWPCIDALQLEGLNDIPMGEFWKRVPEKSDAKIQWADNYHICDTVQQAASAAHIYGKPVCQAEAFTSLGPNWEEDLFDIKDIGDKAFCAGLTRNVLCFYVHQPRLDIKPGYQWELAGTHFDRNVTWWNQSHAWLTYLSRCQYLLRQGTYVADVCYYYGEDAPAFVPAKTHMRPALPPGYSCDTINAEVLLHRLSVKDGRLCLPDGLSYRLLVLPERRTISPAILQRLRTLVVDGAVILGPRPSRAAGLADYPRCDSEVARIADEMWGAGEAPSVDRTLGSGRVLSGQTVADALKTIGVTPDFRYRAAPEGANLDYIHRSIPEGEIYFVASMLNQTSRAKCFFRVTGRQPEIWDAVTGEQRKITNFRRDEKDTVVPLTFAPRQSFFVVFRHPAKEPDPKARNQNEFSNPIELTGAWIVHFDPRWGGPEAIVFDSLVDWTKHAEPGVRYYSGSAIYEKRFDQPASLALPPSRTYLDLGRVRNVAEVELNGKNLGVVWTAPWHVDVTDAIKPAGNILRVTVVNLWPNRLIGDAAQPVEKRLTTTNVKKFKPDSPLLESGLLGPVTLKAIR